MLKKYTYSNKKGFLNQKFILLDADKNELLFAEPDFKWTSLHHNYKIETTEKLDNFYNKEALILADRKSVV